MAEPREATILGEDGETTLRATALRVCDHHLHIADGEDVVAIFAPGTWRSARFAGSTPAPEGGTG